MVVQVSGCLTLACKHIGMGIGSACAELEDARSGTGIQSIRPADSEGGHVTVTTEAGDVATYDAVIMATHADVSLAMLGDSCPQV